MTAALTRIADRMVEAVAPRITADASCSYLWRNCHCVSNKRYMKKCMTGCSQVPDHCLPCEYRTYC